MIVLRVRGDGRKYIVSIRTDNWVISGTNHDVWQAFLFAPCAQAPVQGFYRTAVCTLGFRVQ